VAQEITAKSTLIDVCFAVSTALDRVGAVAVLTGGSAATYYVPERYQSRDADFVITMIRDEHAAAAALGELGFVEERGIHVHSKSKYTVEFPPGPLAAGSAIIQHYETVRRGRQTLYVISRTDCVRDRLSAFYHWGDRSSLRTALAVARSGSIDLRAIERWSTEEGAREKFQEFKALYNERRER